MTVRCLFITSSYSRRCFRMSKLWASTFFSAFSTALLTRIGWIGSPSWLPSFSMRGEIRAGPKSALPGLGDDLRLALVVLGVQDVVGDAVAVEDSGEPLRLLDRNRSDEDRLPRLVEGPGLPAAGVELLLLGAVNLVPEVFPDHRLVRGDDHHVEIIDLLELHRFRVGGGGHAPR